MCGEKALTNDRLRFRGGGTEHSGIGGNVAPPETPQTEAFGERFNRRASRSGVVTREKNHAEAELVREIDSGFAGARAKEFARDGDEQARAVAARTIRVDAAAMREAEEGREGAIDDFARCDRAAELRDEADAAGIMVDGRIVATTCHSSLMRGGAENVQLTISIASIDILAGLRDARAMVRKVWAKRSRN